MIDVRIITTAPRMSELTVNGVSKRGEVLKVGVIHEGRRDQFMKATLDQTTVPSGAIISLASALKFLASKREERFVRVKGVKSLESSLVILFS